MGVGQDLMSAEANVKERANPANYVYRLHSTALSVIQSDIHAVCFIRASVNF